MIAQPTLYIPPDIEKGLLDGTLKLTGSVVRWAANGRIHKHLKVVDLPTPEATQEAVRRLASGTKKQYALIILAGGSLVVGGASAYSYVKKRRDAARAVAAEDMPECVTNFEASLRAYVDAGRTGALDANILEELILGLDAVKAFMDEGNEVVISLDNLVPLFDLVIAHTPRLAEAYEINLEDLAEEGTDVEHGVVVSLRRHLEAQKRILSEAA
jgi:hypothetical protein